MKNIKNNIEEINKEYPLRIDGSEKLKDVLGDGACEAMVMKLTELVEKLAKTMGYTKLDEQACGPELIKKLKTLRMKGVSLHHWIDTESLNTDEASRISLIKANNKVTKN